MTEKISRYVDPLTDFGFNRLFGSESDKDIMIEFLNALFEGEKIIVNIIYNPTEHDGEDANEKRILFDLTCTGVDGETFIIEMQRTHQEFFRDRCVFCMSKLISAQLPTSTSDLDFSLKEVYLIGMEFQFSNTNSDYLQNFAWQTDTGEVFFKGMSYKFLELPNFDKKESELTTDLDKWLYLIKNLSLLNKIPDFLDKRIFQKIFEIADMSKMTAKERELYHSDLKAKSEWNAGVCYAEKRAEHTKATEIALKMKEKSLSHEDIAELTGLSPQEIERL